MPCSPPTIRQLAKLAGVSRTTVSMALRNHPRISAATKQRLLAIAKENGYVPDPLVSTLMNKLRTARKERSAEKLAYLTFWDRADNWRQNVNELAYFEGACERAAQLGYEIEHFWARDPAIRSERLSRILYTRGIRGVLLAPLPLRPGHVSLDWRHFACAAVSLTVLKPGLHRASHDYHRGMILALRMLKRHGCCRIGFANSMLFDQRVNHGWLSGFLTYEHQLPVEQRIPPLLVDGWTRNVEAPFDSAVGRADPHRNAFAQWLERWRPDAIVSNTEHPYVIALSLGLRVPRDLAYVSLHRLRDSDPWAGIDRRPRRIAAAAVDLVAGQLQSNEFGLPECPKMVTIEGVWRDGPSVRNGPSEDAEHPKKPRKRAGRRQKT